MNRYTFNPPEDELINYYLNNKITENDDPEGKQINEVNICHHEPADLPGLAKIESGHTWYFISPVEKFGKLNRRKRASKTGHWKITGNSCTIKDTDGNPIGLKKFLVFQENKNRRSSTLLPTTVQQHKFTWIIHEFHSFLHHPNKMLTHHKDPVEDYGGDYCNDLEELTPELDSSRWLDHSYQFDSNHWGSFADTTHVRTKFYLITDNSSTANQRSHELAWYFMIY
uniref:NAC domain-containing protein n=1 Tax=Brassica campestris TaxID=3711 RepID=M4EWW2_BRACM